jgi:ribosomal protein L16 Arg81 hydroxylase
MEPQTIAATSPRVVERSHVIERLSELLLDGMTADAAALQCSAEGAEYELAKSEAVALMAHPLFKPALTKAVRLYCREWQMRVYAQLAAWSNEASAVDVRTDLSREDFLSTYYRYNRAVCCPGIAKHFPAISKWNKHYLSEHYGEVEIEVMMGRDMAASHDRDVATQLRHTMVFADYMELVYSGRVTNDYYMVSSNGFFSNQATRPLLQDIGPLSLISIDEAGRHVRMWFGPAGTYTHLHYDDRNILIVQVIGRKTVRLYAPYFAEAMEQVRPFYAAIDPQVVDVSVHPNAVDAIAAVVELEPGDAIFLPVGWWHAIQARDVSMTLSFLDFGVPNSYPTSW